ncbi:hypothetical protein, partial [Desulfobulbus propionicus]
VGKDQAPAEKESAGRTDNSALKTGFAPASLVKTSDPGRIFSPAEEKKRGLGQIWRVLKYCPG